MKNESFRNWSVVGGVIRKNSDVLLVANRRKDSAKLRGKGGIDWSPPGGVVDQGESELEALEREVYEETGLRVSTWSEFILSLIHISEPTRPY